MHDRRNSRRHRQQPQPPTSSSRKRVATWSARDASNPAAPSVEKHSSASRHVVAQSQAAQAREQLQLVRSGPRSERIAAARAQVTAAEAAVAQVDATLGNASIVAPFAGIVTERHREPGETVGAGQPVITLMNPADRWVRIYVREDRVGRVSLGQAARIMSDSHPDSTFTGRVVHIASEAEFTPRNVQTDEERVKLVYALRVQITGDGALMLKPGVPADVVLLEDSQR